MSETDKTKAREGERENVMSHVRLAQTLQAGYVNTPRSDSSWTQQTRLLSNPSACCCATLFSSLTWLLTCSPLPLSLARSPALLLSLSPGRRWSVQIRPAWNCSTTLRAGITQQRSQTPQRTVQYKHKHGRGMTQTTGWRARLIFYLLSQA